MGQKILPCWKHFVRSARPNQGFGLGDSAYSMLLMLPLFLWIVITMIYPLAYGVQLSFTSTRLIGMEGRFVGLTNYARVLTDGTFLSALQKSIVWTLGNALLQTILGLGAGLLLERVPSARGSMRVWILLPWIVPTVAIAILWRWLLSASYGVINYVLTSAKIVEVGIPFLGSPSAAMPTSIAVNSWRWFPFLAIITLAGLLSIPREEYEAAKMDGAGFWQELRFITMPYLTPTLVILGLIGTLWSFNMFDVLWLLTQGGPADTTQTLPVLVYELAFREYFLGRAAAISVIMTLMLLVILILYFRVNKKAVSLFVPREEEG